MSDTELETFIEIQREVKKRHKAELQEQAEEHRRREVLFQLQLEEQRKEAKVEQDAFQSEINRLESKIASYNLFLEDYIGQIMGNGSSEGGTGFYRWRGLIEEIDLTGPVSMASHEACPPSVLDMLLNQALKNRAYVMHELVEAIAKHPHTPPESLRRINEQYDDLNVSEYKNAAQLARKNINFRK
jgi:DNA primase catalytic subunit